MDEKRIFQKHCPECSALNTTTNIEDEGHGYAAIVFNCARCHITYRHWYYKDRDEVIIKPFIVLCVGKATGLTPGITYQAISCCNESKIIIIENDDENDFMEYDRSLFIIDKEDSSDISHRSLNKTDRKPTRKVKASV